MIPVAEQVYTRLNYAQIKSVILVESQQPTRFEQLELLFERKVVVFAYSREGKRLRSLWFLLYLKISVNLSEYLLDFGEDIFLNSSAILVI